MKHFPFSVHDERRFSHRRLQQDRIRDSEGESQLLLNWLSSGDQSMLFVFFCFRYANLVSILDYYFSGNAR